MRLPAAIVASLIGASLIGATLTAAPAQAEDRFGPARAVAAPQVAPAPAASASFDSGRALAWGGKMRPRDLSTSDVPAERPTPLVDGLLRHTSAAPRIARAPAVAPPSAPSAAAPRPYAAQPVQLRGPVPAPAPASAPVPVRAPSPAPAPTTKVASIASPAPVAPAPAPTPAAAPTPPASTAVVAGLTTNLFDETPAPAPEPTMTRSRPVTLAGAPGAAGTTTVGSRYYSLHRGYGVEPDPIPMTQTGVGQ